MHTTSSYDWQFWRWSECPMSFKHSYCVLFAVPVATHTKRLFLLTEKSRSIALLEYCCSVALIQTTTFCTCMWVGLFWSSRSNKLLMNISSSFCCVYRVPLATLRICGDALERMFGPYMREDTGGPPSQITPTIEDKGQRGKFTTSNFQRANSNVCTHFTVVMSLCWKSWVRRESFSTSVYYFENTRRKF